MQKVGLKRLVLFATVADVVSGGYLRAWMVTSAAAPVDELFLFGTPACYPKRTDLACGLSERQRALLRMYSFCGRASDQQIRALALKAALSVCGNIAHVAADLIP